MAALMVVAMANDSGHSLSTGYGGWLSLARRLVRSKRVRRTLTMMSWRDKRGKTWRVEMLRVMNLRF